MPPSSRKMRARRADEMNEASDADTPEAIATPSKPTRKRGRTNETITTSVPRPSTRRKIKDLRNTEREDTEGTEAQELTDAETEPGVPTEVEVISKLKVSDKFVYATADFSNDLLEGRENVPGYGKIAGRNWTYIIKDVEVNIGRPEQHEKLEQSEQGHEQESSPSHKSKISIDLGPDRQISRLHATIAYDSNEAQWYIMVNGRNGLRVDTQPLKRGAKAYLRSGNVIDVCGTQMAFVTTATSEDDGPTFADAIIRQTYTSEEEDGEGDANGRSHAQPAPGAADLAGRGRAGPAFSDDPSTGSRIHPHSQANNRAMAFAQPGTPTRAQQPFDPSRSQPSPASAMHGYSRGVMIESTETIDYASDAAKDLKPPHSYAQLIGMAILSTAEQQMTLNHIYKWIMANYAFYRHNTGGWQNSIRHNLSLNKAFEKIARRTDEPGKGMKWMLSPKERDHFLSQGMKGCRRPPPLPAGELRDGSDPSSPAHMGAARFAQNQIRAGKIEDTRSPPTSFYAPTYPTANEAYTPERGSRRPLNNLEDHDPELIYYPPSARSTLNHLTAAANAAGSPPALYTNDDGRLGMLDTPFPIRSSQKLMPPSTLQRPSAFVEFSSPAPFWKFGSTPLRPLTDMSPLKTPFSTFRPLEADVKKTEDDDHDMDKKNLAGESDGQPIQSSSPPGPTSAGGMLDGSPSRTISRPITSQGRGAKAETPASLPIVENGGSFQPKQSDAAGTQDVSQSTRTPSQTPQLEQSSLAPAAPINRQAQMSGQSQSNGQMQPMSAPQPVAHAHAPNPVNRYEPEEEDGIDLARGFQPIGSFHKMGAARFGLGLAGPGTVGR